MDLEGPWSALLLLSASRDGEARAAMLSIGEVLADDAFLWLALWPKSATTANVTATGQATLLAIDSVGAFRIRLAATRVAEPMVDGSQLVVFRSLIRAVDEDRVDYATLTSGITFELPQRDDVLARWRRTIDVLRAISRDPAI
jgi:hypothetical protein